MYIISYKVVPFIQLSEPGIIMANSKISLSRDIDPTNYGGMK